MRRLSPETQTLYAELMEQLTAIEARRSIGNLKGCFTTKEVKGENYCYFQYSGLNGLSYQVYIGKKSPALDKLVKRFKEEKVLLKPDTEHVQKLCAQIKAGGAMTADSSTTRVIKSLADSGVFQLNSVLVGTHAFGVMGNMLGVHWETHVKTHDIDIAASKHIDIVVPDLKPNVPDTLEKLQLGFLPVPALNPKNPSTSFKVRGSTLMVDILTPASKESEKPVFIASLNTSAQPLPFLDYLIEGFEKGAIINSTGILVNVPNPARFAFHKLIISRERSIAMHSKAEKDIAQAANLFAVLAEDRTGDLLIAFEDVKKRGKKWISNLGKGLALLKVKSPVEYGKLLSAVPAIIRK
ncbi:MAG: hypothetical protein KKH28_03070 [Elusimicrobia bacterium]|nr:hypothetical protein [Elusimicrobiota bacterium]